MKLRNVLSLVLLLQFPLSHAVCNGYEGLGGTRAENMGIYSGIGIIPGTIIFGIGARTMYKAAQHIIHPEPTDEDLSMRDPRGTAFSQVKSGLSTMAFGTGVVLLGLAPMVLTESVARYVCCKAIDNSTYPN